MLESIPAAASGSTVENPLNRIPGLERIAATGPVPHRLIFLRCGRRTRRHGRFFQESLVFSFQPQSYGAAWAALLTRRDPNDLGPGEPNLAMATQLRRANPERLFAAPIGNRNMALCCMAAVWLMHDFLDESHAVSQKILTAEGSYWHGVMHRREGDYSNAKYWFHRVGPHPFYEALGNQAYLLQNAAAVSDPPDDGTRDWDPYQFVNRCAHAHTASADAEICRQLAWLEWQMLFDYCYRGALKR